MFVHFVLELLLFTLNAEARLAVVGLSRRWYADTHAGHVDAPKRVVVVVVVVVSKQCTTKSVLEARDVAVERRLDIDRIAHHVGRACLFRLTI